MNIHSVATRCGRAWPGAALASALALAWLVGCGPAAPLAPAPAAAAAGKSIAVLPFENLSDDKANAYFAAGIEDEILTDLAHLADLKVISRTSTRAYGLEAGLTHNVRQIGRELGVAHVLTGSVQRAGGRVRVAAQLIDARTDTHVWADRFDGDLADIFTIQSQMAARIAASLRARLSPDEQGALAARPTGDLAAYDLYLQAKELVASFQQAVHWRDPLLRAVDLLGDATARDGRFALAYCLAAHAHGRLYFTGQDTTPRRLALMEEAVAAALRLQPDLGEAHLARAALLYHGARDYVGARNELAVAAGTLPNSAEVFSLTSYLDRRQGRWPEALAAQNRALALDPRNPEVLDAQTLVYDMLRLYREEIRTIDTAQGVVPGSAHYLRLLKAEALLSAGARGEARAQLDELPAGFDPEGGATCTRVSLAMQENRPAEARAALAAFTGETCAGIVGPAMPRAWLEGRALRAAGGAEDAAGAQAAFGRVREVATAAVQANPDDAGALALLGLAEAGLDHRADALRAARRAWELRPVSADAMDGPGIEAALALVCAWTDEPALAMTHLLALEKTPGGPDYGQLRHDPAWETLRGRQDFKDMLARMDPKMER